MKRLPIRLRVTLAFAGATAVLLVALGLFIYLRFESRLDGTINQNLRTRASEVAHLLLRAGRAGGPANALLVEGEESFAQALTLAQQEARQGRTSTLLRTLVCSSRSL